MSENRVTILVAIEDADVRDRVLAALAAGAVPPPPRPFFDRVCHEAVLPGRRGGPLLEAATEVRLRELFRRSRDAGVVLLSDGLVDDSAPGAPASSEAARELFIAFGDRYYSTVAISRTAARVEDVDRAVSTNCSPDDLATSLKLCMDRLAYLRVPAKNLPAGAEVYARPIRMDNDTEVQQYFALRYQVYLAMCYLDPTVEGNRAGLEIDWFDTHGIHFGAFTVLNGYEELIGTARLITTEDYSAEDRDRIHRLADQDQSLRQWVEKTTNGARLPALHGRPDLLRRVGPEDLVLGEVSRVIVRQQYRGWGVAHTLMDQLVKAAAARRVNDLFLECLPVHEKLYISHGFRRPRAVGPWAGNVYGINRTMMVMHRSCGNRSVLSRAVADVPT